MKRIWITAALMIATAVASYGQRGMLDNHIGARFGLGSGVSFQHRFTDEYCIEVLAIGRYGGLNLTGLYHVHNPFFDVRSIKWYIGGGGHTGIYSQRARNFENETGNTITLGLDGIIGLEYYFHDMPLQMSIDWKPAFNLISSGQTFNEWDCGALSVRYRF
ncbi:MAG: hypothetical protein ACKVOR_05935 [Flavobacteriales bacterium]